MISEDGEAEKNPRSPHSPSCPPERDARKRRMEDGGTEFTNTCCCNTASTWILSWMHLETKQRREVEQKKKQKNLLASEEEADKVQYDQRFLCSSAHHVS